MSASNNRSGARVPPVSVAEIDAAHVAEALRVIAATPAEEFDGHTEFHRLSPAQRLAWMESALELIESRRAR